MILGSDFPMSVVQVAIDSPAPDCVRGVVGVGHGEALENAELRLDEVEPRSFGGGPHRMDVQLAHEARSLGWS